MAREGWRLLAVALVLATPVALAAEYQGDLVVRGTMRLEGASRVQGEPAALFVLGDPDAAVFSSFTIHASELTLHAYSQPYVALSGASFSAIEPTRETRVLHNVSVAVEREIAEAFVGIAPREGAALAFEASGPASLGGAGRTVFGHKMTQFARDSDEEYYFYKVVDAPHTLVQGPGAIAIQGPFAVKVQGFVLDLQSAEGRRRVETSNGPPSPAGAYDVTWAILEGRDLRLEMTTTRSVSFALRGEVGVATGGLAFRAVDGLPSAEDAAGTPMRLQGTLSALLRPETGDDVVDLRMRLWGDVAAASAPILTTAGASAAPAAPGMRWVLLLGAVALMGGAGATYALRRRPGLAPPGPVRDAEQCVAHADACISEGDLPGALPWVARARRLAPTSASVCTTHAFLLGALDRVDEALEAYLEASRLAPRDGEPALCAARLAHEAGRSPALVEDLLEQALARDPRLVVEVEGDGYFAALEGRPRFDHLLEHAWQRHAADLSRPEDGA